MYAGIRYPAHMANIAAVHLDTGKIEELKDIKGPALYYVTSLAWDLEGTEAFLHHRQQRLARPECLRRGNTPRPALVQRFPHRRPGVRSQDNSLWGVRHNNGIVHAG